MNLCDFEEMRKIATKKYNFRFEILTAVTMKSTIFWNVTPSRPPELSNILEGLIALIFRDEKLAKQTIGKTAASTLKMETVLSSEILMNFYRTHGVTSQRILLFKVNVAAQYYGE
jgi:hypothetical protein